MSEQDAAKRYLRASIRLTRYPEVRAAERDRLRAGTPRPSRRHANKERKEEKEVKSRAGSVKAIRSELQQTDMHR